MAFRMVVDGAAATLLYGKREEPPFVEKPHDVEHCLIYYETWDGGMPATLLVSREEDAYGFDSGCMTARGAFFTFAKDDV